VATAEHEDRVRAQQDTLLQAVAAGVTAVPELVRLTGVSRPTVIARLNELEAAGAVTCHRGKGRRPTRVELHRPGLRRASAAPITPHSPASGRLGPGEFIVWLDAPLRGQRRLARRLWSEGAASVFDCHGSATVLGVFHAEETSTAYRLLRSITEADDLSVGSVTVIGTSAR
jgi:DprA winged helix domain